MSLSLPIYLLSWKKQMHQYDAVKRNPVPEPELSSQGRKACPLAAIPEEVKFGREMPPDDGKSPQQQRQVLVRHEAPEKTDADRRMSRQGRQLRTGGREIRQHPYLAAVAEAAEIVRKAVGLHDNGVEGVQHILSRFPFGPRARSSMARMA